MPGKVRRIVTGLNASGQSIIASDMLLPAAELETPDAPVRAGMWLTDAAPASNTGPDPVPDGAIEMVAPQHKGGTVFRIADIPPESVRPGNAEELRRRGANIKPNTPPGFHQTHTVDYAICLEGEIWAVMDEGETLMRQGDVLIQRGTYHGWSNRSNSVCRMAFILIDAEPLAE